MANSILSSLFTSSALAIVNENTGFTTLKGLNVASADIESPSQVTDNPMSSEQLSSEATYKALLAGDIKAVKIICPARAKISVLIETLSQINAILSLFAAVDTTVTLTSKSVALRGMALVAVDIEQSPEMLSATEIEMYFEQANPPGSSPTFNPAQQADASSLGINVQAPPTLVQSATDLYNKVSSITGL